MKVINDFLPEHQFKGLQSYVMGEFFPWWYNTEVDFPNDNSYLDDYQFTHVFYADKGIEPFPEEESKYPDAVILDPISALLKINKPKRIKANLLPRTENRIIFNFHNDIKEKETDYPGQTAIFYVNTNDGYTEFEDGTRVESVANKIVIFDSKLKHRGTTCTNQKTRVVINLNYV